MAESVIFGEYNYKLCSFLSSSTNTPAILESDGWYEYTNTGKINNIDEHKYLKGIIKPSLAVYIQKGKKKD